MTPSFDASLVHCFRLIRASEWLTIKVSAERERSLAGATLAGTGEAKAPHIEGATPILWRARVASSRRNARKAMGVVRRHTVCGALLTLLRYVLSHMKM